MELKRTQVGYGIASSRSNTPCNRTDHAENLEKVGLGDGGVKLSDIKGS
jgi:hypothetical protein